MNIIENEVLIIIKFNFISQFAGCVHFEHAFPLDSNSIKIKMLPFRWGMLFGVLLIVAYANGAAIVSVKIVNEISVCVFVCVCIFM